MSRPVSRQQGYSPLPGASSPMPSIHSRKLTQEEMDKAVDRLTRTRPVTAPPPPPQKTLPKLSAEETTEMAERMSTSATKRAQATHDRLEEKYLHRPATPMMSEDDKQVSISRLYTQGIERQQRKREALVDKYMTKPVPVKKSSEAVKHGVQSLFYDEKTRAAKSRERLFDKYVTSVGPKVPHLDQGQINDVVGRLFTGQK